MSLLTSYRLDVKSDINPGYEHQHITRDRGDIKGDRGDIKRENELELDCCGHCLKLSSIV